MASQSQELTTFEIKQSKQDTPVPVINGIHLHSAYNPAREAEGFVEKYDDVLQKQNRILVLGLGFGYHIWALESRLRRYHDQWTISVIEPNINLKQQFETLKPVELSQNVDVFSYPELNLFYDNLDLVHFMASKPQVIAHPASFNLYESFFKNFMSFQASNNLFDVSQKVFDISLRQHMQSMAGPDEDFDQALLDLQTRNAKSSHDKLLNFFRELTGESAQ